MSSIGTGYDLSNSVFSPDGRNFQVEYASKAVENGSTSIAIKCQDGVVFAVEKIITSKLLVPGANKRIQTVDKHIGIVYSGLVPDGRHIVSRGRSEAYNWRSIYKVPIPVESFANRLGSYTQAYTLYNSVRPFGITTILGGVDEYGPHLYMIEPSGSYWGYLGAAAGKGRQIAKNELEKLDLSNLTARDAVNEAARIIYLAHEDTKEKDFELEISWVSISETGGVHTFISEEHLVEAKRFAEQATNEDDEMEE